MKDNGQKALRRLLVFALACPLALTALALVAALGNFWHASKALEVLGVHAEYGIAFSTFLIAAGVASLYARGQLLRVSRDHARALQLAREALDAREDFLSVASHELKTPLTSLRLQVGSVRRSLLTCSNPSLAGLSERLAMADRQVDQLAQLINGLADSSRLETLQLALERVDLVTLTREVVARHSGMLSQAGCQVSLRLPPSAVTGTWDAARLGQSLSHLLSNAAKYGRGRPIEVEVSFDEGWGLISVRDHGIGVDPKLHGKIFERFERAVSPRHYGGFGLGLWMVRRVVHALGGSISVESRKGNGSTFTLELPGAELSEPTAVAHAPTVSGSRFCLAHGARIPQGQEGG